MSQYCSFCFSFLLLLSLSTCVSKETPREELPPQDLPEIPNCAADGPGCKQFNPDLKK